MSSRLIGIDFGTTNSVVASLEPDGSVRSCVYPVGQAQLDVFRTVLCFWNEKDRGRNILRHAAGPYGVQTYLDDPQDSRLILSMKTYLAQHSFTRTNIFGHVFTLEKMIGLFLDGLLAGGERDARVIAGRPVRFAGESADDAFGEARLRAGFAQAGFGTIDLALEPELSLIHI